MTLMYPKIDAISIEELDLLYVILVSRPNATFNVL